jgi:hypothetical protein
MIGLFATFFVVAYLLVPSGLFRSFYSLFLPRIIKFQRTRAEEFTFAVLASILPFFLALALVWTVANWPFGIQQSSSADRRDAYRIVLAAAINDKALGEQGQNHVYWAATNQVIRRQGRFLVWYYVLVLLEAWICAWLTRNYRAVARESHGNTQKIISLDGDQTPVASYQRVACFAHPVQLSAPTGARGLGGRVDESRCPLQRTRA